VNAGAFPVHVVHEREAPRHPLGAQELSFLTYPGDRGQATHPGVTVIRSHWPPRAAGRLHRHADWDEMFYVISGDGVLTVEGREIPLSAGSFVVARRGAEHAVTATGPDGLEVLAILSPGPSPSAVLPNVELGGMTRL